MRVFVKVLMFLSLCSIFSVVAKADEVKIPMADGTKQVVKTYRIYSTSNPANNLVEAVAANDLAMIKDLIANGADVNTPGASGLLPILEALSPEKSEILDFLLANGADVNIEADVMGMKSSALEVAVANDYTQAVQKLLEHGAKTEKEGLVGDTIIFTAIDKGNVEIIKLLVKHGADLAHKDMLGDTPVSKAEASGKPEIVAIFKGLK
jgi:ankyrin repeat protein